MKSCLTRRSVSFATVRVFPCFAAAAVLIAMQSPNMLSGANDQ